MLTAQNPRQRAEIRRREGGPASRGHRGSYRPGGPSTNSNIPVPLLPAAPRGSEAPGIPAGGAGLPERVGGGGGLRERGRYFPRAAGDVSGRARGAHALKGIRCHPSPAVGRSRYISGGGRRGADARKRPAPRIAAERRPQRRVSPTGPRPPPEEHRAGPARAATTRQQIWIPRPASPRLLPPGGPRRSGRSPTAPPPRRPAPRTPAAPWRPPSPAS